MPRKKSSTSKAVTKWDEQLAQDAQIAAEMEANTGGGQFFSLRGGVLSWQDSPLPDNEMVVIILDSIFETVYYDEPYNADEPQSPTAFAFGREEKELRWHENSDPEFAGQLCSESEVCQWGSADTGKGKAARETRRLAMIVAGQFTRDDEVEIFEELDHFEKTTLGFMKLPVTSVGGYANFVKQIAGTLKRPPYGIITRVAVVPDAKTQFKVVFEALEPVDDELMPVIMQRREEAMEIIDFPYQVDDEEEAPAPRKKRASAKRPARKKTAAKKKSPARKKTAAKKKAPARARSRTRKY